MNKPPSATSTPSRDISRSSSSDPLPPPVTVSTRALSLRGSRSRSSTGSRCSNSALPLESSVITAPMDVGHSLDHGVGDTNTKPDLATKDPTKRDRDTPADVDLEYNEQDQPFPKRRRLTSPDSKTPRDTNEGTSLGISGSTPSAKQNPRLLPSEVEIPQPQAALELESTEHLTEVNAFRGETAGIPQSISPRSPQTGSANLPNSAAVASSSRLDTRPPVPQDHEPLSAYICPICFSPPKYATLTPCGHVCCGECLFAAVKTTIQRAMDHGPVAQRAKCPVCRVPIPGWDGRGGGVIGLKPRVLFSLGNRKPD